jgi:hypothetical protein
MGNGKEMIKKFSKILLNVFQFVAISRRERIPNKHRSNEGKNNTLCIIIIIIIMK